EHRKPDRVPIDFGGSMTTVEVEAYESLKKVMGIESKTMVFSRAHVVPDERILEKFKVDTRCVYFNLPEEWDPDRYPDNTYVDDWGVTWKMPKGSFYYDPVDFPFKEPSHEELEDFEWPVKVNSGNIARWHERSRYLAEQTEYCVVSDVAGYGLFEQAWALRKLDNFLMDLIINRDYVEDLLDRVLYTQKKRLDAYLCAAGPYLDVMVISDDLATQDAPLISPDMYRDIVKPRHKDLIAFIKKKTDAKIFYHSCGDVTLFIEDLIDVGVDILNPVQVSSKNMSDTNHLKNKYGSDIVFWGGGCDTQNILPFGSVDEVRSEVKRRVFDLGPGGGFVFAAVHNIQPDVPPGNIMALYEAAYEYGSSLPDIDAV
ncbi:MAG: uroporphyrinogen decarboxylase family protein, partial [Planctomycetota bacterium]